MSRTRIVIHSGFFLLAFGLAAPMSAIAQMNLFIDSGQRLGMAQSTGVALGDLDGDTDLDAFVANSNGPSTVWINQGGSQGGAPGAYLDSGQTLGVGTAQDVALGDLDGDNDLDAFVVLDSFDDSNQVWINQGGAQAGSAGVFQLSGQIFGDDASSAVALGDVDGDNDLDAFVTRNLSRADKIWLNDASGQFSDSGQTLGSDDGVEVALRDVDGDLDLDAFVANGAANRVWINQGGDQAGAAGTFLDSGQTLGGVLSLSVGLGDLDGDGDLDAFVGNNAGDVIWLNQGGVQAGAVGTFLDSGQSLGSTQSRDLTLGDVDGDGDLDAFIGKNGPEVWINQGGAQGGAAGVFLDSGLSLGNGFAEGVALGDIDGDADLDSFAANFDGPNKVFRNTNIDPLTQVNPVGWQIQLADTRGGTGRGTSLVLDAGGLPHISSIRHLPFRSGLDHAVIYARFDGVRWLTQVVERFVRSDTGAVTSLALDAAGNPHIAYWGDMDDSGPRHLRYAFWDGNQWQVQTVDVDSELSKPRYLSLALDSGDDPHISYELDGDQVYAFWDGLTWQFDVVEDPPGGSEHNVLALDSGDQPHIAYLRPGREIKYARRIGAVWQVEIVDNSSEGFIDLILDGADSPHVSYVGDLGETLHYARRDIGGWQIDLVAGAPPSSFALNGHTSLALDAAGRPHISYWVSGSLQYARHDGVQWQTETVDDARSVGFFNSLALDAGDNARIAYYDGPHGDLRYASWDTRWQTQSIDALGVGVAPSVAVADGLPVIGYHDLTAGPVRSARWENEAWTLDSVDFVSNPVTQTSMVQTASGQLFASYYDADGQRLMFGAWNGASWNASQIDAGANVGRHNRLLLINDNVAEARIAYWDASNLLIKLASLDALDATMPMVRSNTAGPVLDASSGPLGATVLPGGDIGISYYDGANGDLRMATWQAATGAWSDEPIETDGDIGAFNDIATDGSDGFPVVAYHDASVQVIKYAYRDAAGVWQMETAVNNVASLSALSLELGLNSRLHGRIAYIDTGNDALRVALRRNGTWYLETVATTGGAADLALAVGQRPHLAVTESGVGLSHVFRTATLDVLSSPYAPPPPSTGFYNPLDGCVAFFKLLLLDVPDKRSGPTPRGPAPSPPLSDEEIFQLLPSYFGQSFGGQHYVDLYLEHGAEMGQLALADMDLLSDSYGMLQNFLPGLEALVSGQGDELLISQPMVDDALSVWQRLAAAGSPGLSQTINAELAKYNNLQDFVGLSFSEWFASLKGQTIFANGFE